MQKLLYVRFINSSIINCMKKFCTSFIGGHIIHYNHQFLIICIWLCINDRVEKYVCYYLFCCGSCNSRKLCQRIRVSVIREKTSALFHDMKNTFNMQFIYF